MASGPTCLSLLDQGSEQVAANGSPAMAVSRQAFRAASSWAVCGRSGSPSSRSGTTGDTCLRRSGALLQVSAVVPGGRSPGG
jgi:hypothetical protein